MHAVAPGPRHAEIDRDRCARALTVDDVGVVLGHRADERVRDAVGVDVTRGPHRVPGLVERRAVHAIALVLAERLEVDRRAWSLPVDHVGAPRHHERLRCADQLVGDRVAVDVSGVRHIRACVVSRGAEDAVALCRLKLVQVDGPAGPPPVDDVHGSRIVGDADQLVGDAVAVDVTGVGDGSSVSMFASVTIL